MEKNIVIIGGSDAGISAALKVKELEPETKVTIIMADEYPNLSICGIPYAIGGDVADWHNLAHRGIEELESTGIIFEFNTYVKKINSVEHTIEATTTKEEVKIFTYSKLLVATGALPVQGNVRYQIKKEMMPKIKVLHTMDDYFEIENSLEGKKEQSIGIVGSGYIGIEMAEGLKKRNAKVTLIQRGPEILSTVDSEFGKRVHSNLIDNGIDVVTNFPVESIEQDGQQLFIKNDLGEELDKKFDQILLVIGVKPNTKLLADAGAKIGETGSIVVDERMQTSITDIFAAGDLVETKHLLMKNSYLPLGTTAHKQGRIAGYNLLGIDKTFKGIVGTQVIKVFDQVVARTGLLETEAQNSGYDPISSTINVDDHKFYIPGAQKILIKVTVDKKTNRLLGAQLLGKYGSEIAKRNDIFATAIYNEMTAQEISDLDLSYSPPLGSPWDAVQMATQKLENKTAQ